MNTWESLDSIKIPLIFWTMESQTQYSDFGVLLQLFVSFSCVESRHSFVSLPPPVRTCPILTAVWCNKYISKCMCQQGFCLVSRKGKSRKNNVYHKPPPSHSVGCRTKIPELMLIQGGRSGILRRQVPACAQKLYRYINRALLLSLGGQPSVLGLVIWWELWRWSICQTLRLKSNVAGALLSHPLSQHGSPQLSCLELQWMLKFTRCIFQKSESIPCEWSLREL